MIVSKGNRDVDAARHTDVGSRSAILEVTVALGSNMTRDTDGGSTVGNTRAELADVAGFVATSETHVVVVTVDGDVLVMALAEALNGSFDGLDAVGFTHGLCGEVGVASGTIPVALEGLGVEGDLDAPLFGNTDEEIPGHPEVVTHGDTFTGANLELPLRGHNLGVDTADVDARVEAGTVVSLDEITGKDLAST